MDDENGEVNPYRELIVNKAEKIESPMTRMEQWSILLIKLKFMCNKAVLDIKNAGKDTMILKTKEMIGIL